MRFLFSLLLALPLVACAAEQSSVVEKFKEGKHYVSLTGKQPFSSKKKIEVTEVFWYGCSHCFAFEPLLNKWQTQVAADVKVLHSPAIWRKVMELHARAYYTAKALKVLDKVHPAVFKAMNIDKKKLSSEDSIAKLFVAQGVDEAKFRKTFNSFGVTAQVRQADARARSFGITGTPEMVVANKYRTSGSMAGSQAKMLEVVDFLIEKERKARAL